MASSARDSHLQRYSDDNRDSAERVVFYSQMECLRCRWLPGEFCAGPSSSGMGVVDLAWILRIGAGTGVFYCAVAGKHSGAV